MIRRRLTRVAGPLRATATAAASALATVGLAGCAGGMTELQSQPLSGPIAIDANHSEWWGSLTEVGSDLSVGFRNDADYLYVSLMTTDRDVVDQMMFEGLIVWFDPTGREAKTFGVLYPLGVMAAGRLGLGGGAGRGTPPAGLERGELDPATRERLYERSMAGGSILTAGGDTVRLGDDSGIEFEGRADYGGFVYELRVPLRSGPEWPYAIGAERGQAIAVGFITAEVDIDELLDRAAERSRDAGRPAGGAAGQPGGGFGGQPGGPGGPGFSLPDPIEEWALVTLW